jgi:hypothetical protein
VPFSSFDKDDGSAITMTNFAAADILIYKDGGTTERASTAGFTATTDFDGKTGKHLAIIDLADNTTAGFYNAGSEYMVAIDSVTVDGVTTGGWIARFRIGHPAEWYSTTIASLSSQTSFTLTTGPAEDDALNGHWCIIHDIASAVQCGKALILDYTGSTKTVTLAAGTTFTAAAGDNISIMDMAPLQPATIGRTAAIGTAGQADANVTQFGGTNLTATGGIPAVNATQIEGSDATNQIRDAVVDDATRIDASALNTLSGHDPGETIMGATDLGTGAGLTTLATQSSVNTIDDLLDTDIGALTSELAKVPKSDGTASWNATALAAIQSEANDALVAYDPPTRAEATSDADSILAAVADVPTNAELATALAGADDAVLAAIAALNNISVANILGATVEGSTTLVQSLRLLNAALGGKASGLETTTAVYRNIGDSKDRITATVDADGNRSAVTLDLT